MKKILFFFSFLMLSTVAINAQSKTCTKKKACCKSAAACTKSKASKKSTAFIEQKASALASEDATIESKVCEKTGATCYYRTGLDVNGNTIKTKVLYSPDSNSFVAVDETNSVKSAEAKALMNDIQKSKKAIASERKIVSKKAVTQK